MQDDRIIIAKDGIKRELTFPFEICLSKAAAHWLRDQLKQMDHDEGCYGWITISSRCGSQGLANTPPLKWTDTHGHER